MGRTGQKKLQNFLILNKYISSLFSLKSIADFREQLRHIREGISPNAKFFFTEVLQTLPISNEFRLNLDLYDENIQEYLQQINVRRKPSIQLTYFQYIAILFTEIYLDSFFNTFDSFYEDFVQFVSELNRKESRSNSRAYPHPNKSSMRKLCYWSATGSGKTLIMHFNILQVLKYNNTRFDNVLLVTPPGETLSSQHVNDLDQSNIKNRRFEKKQWDGVGYFTDTCVQVIEISKIKEEVTSQDGLSVPAEAFGEKNILFVDEGHKGHSPEAKVWRGLREQLVGNEGFTFEYSATFGEISGTDETFNEYASTILFDYRYKFFYEDGYGKDYSILNLRNAKDYDDEYFAGSLLSLYEQKLFFKNHQIAAQEFLVYNPLMIYVGTSVSGKKNRSDVFFVCKFFSKFIKDRGRFKNLVTDILENRSSLLDVNNKSVFQYKFQYLKHLIGKKQLQIEDIYEQMLYILFHSTSSKKIRFIEIKKADGEVGLKLGSEYFGLINIGDVSTFLKLVEHDADFIFAQPTHLEESLFKRIEEKTSPINFLLGSKKFREGWNSYRVSSMGLLNIGKKQGAQIIQLFGRGIRLKGYKNFLKRSHAIEVDPRVNVNIVIPKFFTILETLEIYGLNADYMAIFRETLKEEGIKEIVSSARSRKDDILIRDQELSQNAKKLGIFVNEVQITSLKHPIPKVRIDLSSKVDSLNSLRNDFLTRIDSSRKEVRLKEEILEIIDYQEVFLELLKYKTLKNYSNLYFTKMDLIDILKSGNYSIYCKYELFELHSFEELPKINKIQNYIIQLLKAIIDQVYRTNKCDIH
ncbi:MAG: DEAD/DEAH box helicase family protein [Candidatus Heimdallarchaeota archaeon]